MSELVSKDFLSKENTTYLYKTIITSNELDNISNTMSIAFNAFSNGDFVDGFCLKFSSD